MARTVSEISQLIKADFVANVTLQSIYGLDSSKTFDEQFSSVSLEAIFIFIFSCAANLLERIIDTTSAEVDAKIAASQLCSIPWYHARVLEYQHGHALEFNEVSYTFGYSVVDEIAKIIKYAAVREYVDTITKLRIYTNKVNHVPLAAAELTAFQAYMLQVGPVGIHYEFINANPDKLKITVQVIFDPLVISSTGQKITDSSYPVREAITAYVNGITFGGTLNKTKLIDAIQATEGVVDVVLTEVQRAADGGAFSVVSGQNAESSSGSFIIDTLTDTYTPNV